MTCIVGVRTPSGVLLGGDSLGSAGWDSSPRKDVKVFRLNPQVACGFTSSYRMGQILRFHVTPPPVAGDEYEWAVKAFVPAIRHAFKEHGYAKVEHSVEQGGTFLVAVRARLFQINGDFQVGEPIAPFDACGCGQSYAIGAMHALHSKRLAPRVLLRRALEAAEQFSNGVRGPFVFASTIVPQGRAGSAGRARTARAAA